jgi:type VI secretion system secreted protein Hcp
MNVLELEYAVNTPYDVATGQASGKRQHKPLTIVKEWGAASPQLYQALVTNERLDDVTIEFVKTNSDGQDVVFFRIKLTDGHIILFNPYVGDVFNDRDSQNLRDLETISFTFRKIEWTNVESKTSALDDWNA